MTSPPPFLTLQVVVMDAMSGKYHDLTAKYLGIMQMYMLMLAYLLSVVINLEVGASLFCRAMRAVCMQEPTASLLLFVLWFPSHARRKSPFVCRSIWIAAGAEGSSLILLVPKPSAHQN